MEQEEEETQENKNNIPGELVENLENMEQEA